MKSLSVIFALILVVAGCSKPEPPIIITSSPTTAPAASEPSANGAVTAHVISLNDGVDLARVRNQQMITAEFALTPPEVDSPVILAVVENEEQATSTPVVLKKMGAGWRVVSIPEAGDSEWVYAAALTPRHEIFAMFDSAAETLAKELTILHSADAGVTWQFFAAVKKPVADAEFASFTMAATGEGKLTLHLAEDVEGTPHGYYSYKTADGGKRWTGPAFEADDVTEADSQRDFDTLQDAIKNAEAVQVK